MRGKVNTSVDDAHFSEISDVAAFRIGRGDEDLISSGIKR